MQPPRMQLMYMTKSVEILLRTVLHHKIIVEVPMLVLMMMLDNPLKLQTLH